MRLQKKNKVYWIRVRSNSSFHVCPRQYFQEMIKTKSSCVSVDRVMFCWPIREGLRYHKTQKLRKIEHNHWNNLAPILLRPLQKKTSIFQGIRRAPHRMYIFFGIQQPHFPTPFNSSTLGNLLNICLIFDVKKGKVVFKKLSNWSQSLLQTGSWLAWEARSGLVKLTGGQWVRLWGERGNFLWKRPFTLSAHFHCNFISIWLLFYFFEHREVFLSELIARFRPI